MWWQPILAMPSYNMRLISTMSAIKCKRPEQTSIPTQSIDLVTVAQAIHWFDFEAFYSEVKRVLKPQGVVAAIGYGLIQLQDAALNH